MATFTCDHIHLRSLDPVAAAGFYTSVLGATELDRVQNGPALRIILSLAGLRLFIEQVPPGTAAPPAPPFVGVEHIGLAVEDLDAVASEMAGKGVEFTMQPTVLRPDLKIAFIQAPDGVRIELLQRG
jgi:catechol 2,3-dioxygenase-like lactoylglutathione lyase family enzyme